MPPPQSPSDTTDVGHSVTPGNNEIEEPDKDETTSPTTSTTDPTPQRTASRKEIILDEQPNDDALVCVSAGICRIMLKDGSPQVTNWVRAADHVMRLPVHPNLQTGINYALLSASFTVLFLIASAVLRVMSVQVVEEANGQLCFEMPLQTYEAYVTYMSILSGFITLGIGLSVTLYFKLFRELWTYICTFFRHNKALIGGFLLGSLTVAPYNPQNAAIRIVLALLLTPGGCAILDFQSWLPTWGDSRRNRYISLIYVLLWMINYGSRLIERSVEAEVCQSAQKDPTLTAFILSAIGEAAWITASLKMVTLLVRKLRNGHWTMLFYGPQEQYVNLFWVKHKARWDLANVIPLAKKTNPDTIYTKGYGETSTKNIPKYTEHVVITLSANHVRLGPDHECDLIDGWKQDARWNIEYASRSQHSSAQFFILLSAFATVVVVVSGTLVRDVIVLVSTHFDASQLCVNIEPPDDVLTIFSFAFMACASSALLIIASLMYYLQMLRGYLVYLRFFLRQNYIIMISYSIGLLAPFLNKEYLSGTFLVVIGMCATPTIICVFDMLSMSPYAHGGRKTRAVRVTLYLVWVTLFIAHITFYVQQRLYLAECKENIERAMYVKFLDNISSAAWLAGIVKILTLIITKLKTEIGMPSVFLSPNSQHLYASLDQLANRERKGAASRVSHVSPAADNALGEDIELVAL